MPSDMPEPFKNMFNPALVGDIADHLARQWPAFDRDGFVSDGCDGLEALELKDRANWIAAALDKHLPRQFPEACGLLLATLHPAEDATLTEMDTGITDEGIKGWAVMPMTIYVAERGAGHLDVALSTLKEMTKRSSAEFAIRRFLADQPGRTLEILSGWVHHGNRHVRRLVSEGTRPRLPWASRLTDFVRDPSPILPLLESLKDDESDYVRRSVANSLNDIAKDHPDLVVDVARRWLRDAGEQRQRLVRHACRSLVKAGNRDCLKVLGFGQPELSSVGLSVITPTVTIGDALEFELAITTNSHKTQRLVIDYIIHHVKANGKTTPKVFKWKALTLDAGGALQARRRHALRPITTRVYYPGRHRVELMVNGEVFGGADFELEIPRLREA
jgi:3-methyladenine DNA glycosylase AlkC